MATMLEFGKCFSQAGDHTEHCSAHPLSETPPVPGSFRKDLGAVLQPRSFLGRWKSLLCLCREEEQLRMGSEDFTPILCGAGPTRALLFCTGLCSPPLSNSTLERSELSLSWAL